MQSYFDLEDLTDIEAVFAPRRFALQDLSSAPMMRGSQSVSNLTLVPDSFLTPSPEEQIIRQRSRLVKISPTQRLGDKDDQHFLQATPNKESSLSQLTRKRLLLSPEGSPIKTPDKRPRLQRKGTIAPLHTELGGYTQQQLITVIDRLVALHPQLEDEVRLRLPSPDIKPLEKQLVYLRKNIFRAFPTTRWSSSRDAHCYRRVRIHLQAYKKACLEQIRALVAAQCWEAVVRYTVIAWKYTGNLPDWDDPSHNAIKARCFSVLAAQCMIALKQGGFEKEQLQQYRNKLDAVCSVNGELRPCVLFIEKALETLA